MNFQLKACLFLFVKTDIACALLKESLESKNTGPEPISVLDLGQVLKITNSVAPTKHATVHI